jgi:hypothetical protein
MVGTHVFGMSDKNQFFVFKSRRRQVEPAGHLTESVFVHFCRARSTGFNSRRGNVLFVLLTCFCFVFHTHLSRPLIWQLKKVTTVTK